MDVAAKPVTGSAPASAEELKAQQRTLPLVILMFFAWGFCTVLVDTLIPKLKAVFSLTYVEAMLTQFCFFAAYFVISVPAAALLARLGYLRSMMAALIVMACGCMLFTPAAALGLYPAFLGALFILASGITILQVAANPLATILGDPARSHSRLVLAQAFNSLGTTLGPLFGSALILSGGISMPDITTLSPDDLADLRKHEALVFQLPFTLIAAMLVGLAALCWWLRRTPVPTATPAVGGSWGRVLAQPRLSLGAVSIFLYVGAEVSIGSAMVNFLMQGTGADAQHAGNMVALYWGGAMVGRFIGAQVLRSIGAASVLTACAAMGALLAGGSTFLEGSVAAGVVLAVGLFNSVMFPNIFSLAIENLGEDTGSGSGVLCLAIVGGAVVPMIFGYVADHASLVVAYWVPAICYVWIAAYAFMIRKGMLR